MSIRAAHQILCGHPEERLHARAEHSDAMNVAKLVGDRCGEPPSMEHVPRIKLQATAPTHSPCMVSRHSPRAHRAVATMVALRLHSTQAGYVARASSATTVPTTHTLSLRSRVPTARRLGLRGAGSSIDQRCMESNF